MSGQLEVTVQSTNQKLGYTAALRSLTPVTIDYLPPNGDGQGYLPLELLLMSLASCSGGVLGLTLRRMGKTVAGISVSAKGTRRDSHPTSFRTIALEFTVVSGDATEADVGKALKLAEESFCPVWAMVKGNAEITASFSIAAS